MEKTDIKRLEKIVTEQYEKLKNFSLVADIFNLTKIDVIYLVLADEASKLKHFEKKEYDELPIFNFN